ncbi:MAG: hypothetical protein U0K48_02455 [Bacilli bacterium]|nr:hypothetical protein [Bacilli bacterium]
MLNIIDLEDKKTDNEYQLKKKKILRIVLNSEYIQNKNLIFTFLLGDTLDNYIKSLDDNKVNIKINTVIKKGYFTSEEQFLSILDSFITYLSNILNNITLLEKIFSMCINNEHGKVLLSKKYIFDNDNINYFYNKFNLMIINNFYNNLLILKNELTYELDTIDIDLNKFNINNSKDVKKITRILGDICFVNTDREYMLLSLFNSINKINNKILLDHFEILISNYIKNIKFLVEYHKLKESII